MVSHGPSWSRALVDAVTRSKRALAGAGAFAVQFGVRTVSALLMAPLIVRFGAAESLGAYSMLMQLVGYVMLLDLGLSTAIGREVATVDATDDNAIERLGAIVGTGVVGLAAIGLAGALANTGLAITVASWLKAPTEIRLGMTRALIILAVWWPFRFVLSFPSLYLMGRQRIAPVGLMSALGELVRLGATAIFLWRGMTIVGLALANVVGDLVTFGGCAVQARGMLRGVRSLVRVDMSILRRMAAVGVPLAIMSLGDRMTFFSQDIIAGSMLGAAMTGVLYSTRTPGFLGGSVLWRMADSVLPGMTELRANGTGPAMRSAFRRVLGYAMGAAFVFAAGLLAFNEPLISAWVGRDLYAGASATLAVACIIVVATFKNVTSKFIVADGRVGTLSIVLLIEGGTALALSISFVRFAGVTGLLWATVVAHIISLTYLTARSAAIMSTTARSTFSDILPIAFRSAALGAIACAAYALLKRRALVAWPTGLAFCILMSALGLLLGMEHGDRESLFDVIGVIRRRFSPRPAR